MCFETRVKSVPEPEHRGASWCLYGMATVKSLRIGSVILYHRDTDALIRLECPAVATTSHPGSRPHLTRAFALVFAVLIPLVGARAQTPLGEIISLDDEYNLTLPASTEDLRIVQRAKQILNRPEKWDRSDTRVCHVKACNLGCPTLAQTFSLYCALKRATEEVTPRFEHRGRVMQEARFVIDEIAVNRKDFEHRLQGYNNSPERTF